ncbi:hypothetical protein HY085_01990 [Candidatus Gottesmanbacteria bacterium]|nr:hypothetical protein [Candidatus Gottesmanbacteria bacterium]
MKQTIVVILFFTIISVVLFRQWVFEGKVPIAADLQVNFYEPWKSEFNPITYKPLGFDDIRIFYPQRIFSINEFKAGKLPLWNPYEFSGNIHLANSQTAVFYPLFLPYLFLPPLFVWSLMSAITPFLAGIFTYFFFAAESVVLAGAFWGDSLCSVGNNDRAVRRRVSSGAEYSLVTISFIWRRKIRADKKNLAVGGGSFSFSFFSFGRLVSIQFLCMANGGIIFFLAAHFSKNNGHCFWCGGIVDGGSLGAGNTGFAVFAKR